MSEEKSYTQMRRDFQEAFFKQLSPELECYDVERKKLLFIAVFLTIFFILAAFALILFNASILFDNNSNPKEKIIEVLIGGLVLLAIFTYPYLKKYFENSVKEKIMPSVCSCYGNIQWFNGEFATPSDERIFFRSHFVPLSNVKYDDIFIGNYKDVNYEISDATFFIKNGKNKTVYFSGVVVQLDMNKIFCGNTVIYPAALFKRETPLGYILNLDCDDINSFIKKILTKLGIRKTVLNGALDKINDFNLKRTSLEDVKFNKRFDVYTDDEVEARYLITTAFMERLLNIKTAFNADKVQCAFYDKYLLIGLKLNKDPFSICSLVKPINDSKQFFQLYEEILSVIKLIDHFKLDQKTGM